MHTSMGRLHCYMSTFLVFLLAALHGANKVRTYIDQVIRGELLSVVVCDDCQHVSKL